jgi:uncharacterized membrane protein YfcA
MTDFYSFLILFIVGSIAGFINVNAGGGSTLTLPALIFLGLDASVANGTNRIAILFQNVSAVLSFKKEKYQHFKSSIKLAAFTLPGAIIGAAISTRVSDELFETILGIIMIGIIITMIVPNKRKEFLNNPEGDQNWKTYLAMVGIGFYGGFIQVGVGFLLMAALHHLMKLNLVFVNMHKVFVVFIYSIPAIIIFALSNNIEWMYGIGLACGTSFGAWWGAKLSVKKGEKLIKIVLSTAVFIMALKLLGVF